MYNKRKQKAQFKLRKELVAIVGVLTLMVVLSFVLRLPSSEEKFLSSYTEAGAQLTSENVFKEVSVNELVKKINNEELVFVFFGSPSCANCVTEISTINTRATYWDIEEVYYLNSSFSEEKDREEDADFDAELKALEDKLVPNGSTTESALSFDMTPALWVYTNGKLTFNSNDYLNEDETGLRLSWSLVADRAFCVNLTEKVVA